jgi:hypothetical protein
MRTSIQSNVILENVTQNYLYRVLIEQGDETVGLQPRVQEVLGSNVGRDTD